MIDALNVWLVLALTSIASFGAREPFSAFVNKTVIENDEPITLTLEYLGQTDEEPDLAGLEKLFTIVSRQTSSQSSFMNGNFSQKTSWILQIFPHGNEKTVTIPAIKLKSDWSTPITLTRSSNSKRVNDDGVMLTVTVDKKKVYVNAELILNIELKLAVPVQNGSLSRPQIGDAIVEPLIEDGQSELIENGIRYTIIKRSYAIFPSKVGRLLISPVVFKGVLARERGLGHGWPGFFGGGKQVFSRSEEIIVEVMDVPASYPKDQAFLPLKSFIVVESFNDPNQRFLVNKAITRQFEMKAKGTLASFLPVILPPTIDNLQIYAEPGQKNNKNLEDGLEASSQFAHVYMPTAPGQIVVPEQIIYWWDTQADKLRTTVIRSLALDVSGPMPKELDGAVKKSEENAHQSETALDVPSRRWSWPIIIAVVLSLLFIGLLVFLLVAWVRMREFASGKELPLGQQRRQRIKNVIAACAVGDGKLALHHLARLRLWLEQQGEKDHAAAVDLLIRELESVLFGHQNRMAVDIVLAHIKKGVKKLRATSPKIKLLAPLYPN